MSNLRLPNLHYRTLIAKMPKRGMRTLGYKTTVETLPDQVGVLIRHNGNPIAELSRWEVEVCNWGWNTPTTRARINKVLGDNHITAWIGQRNFQQILFANGNEYRDFYSAAFEMIAGVWTLIDFNGDAQ